MANKTTWTLEDLQAALDDVHVRKMSIRTAASAHGIPKSTLYKYAGGKIEVGRKCGPDTVLTTAEEDRVHRAYE